LWYPALPFALIAGGYDAQSRGERLGNVSPANAVASGVPRVWVHAASVGEVEGVRPVVLALRGARPELQFVITTMTAAGRDAASRRLGGACQLAPFDHAAAVRAFVARVCPTLVIITETELWPNFFFQSARAGARIALINGRLSDRSMNRYRLIRPLLARSLSSISLILAQTANDAERFRTLGAPAERIIVAGNSKYELEAAPPPLRPALAGFAEGQPILLAGSTGPGEERTVLTAYRHLVEQFPALALVLAPRHLQRVQEVERELRAADIAFVRASELDSGARPGATPEAPVLLLDTMGELRALYQRAAIAFVGGSLMTRRGGQSLAEPAAASVPVLFGPHYENHRQVGDALIAVGAGKVVGDAAQLASACAQLLADRNSRAVAGESARQVMEQLAGSSAEIVRHLCALLPKL
jgi:3-deoxy-D-manno-octulosonic-acid transferase